MTRGKMQPLILLCFVGYWIDMRRFVYFLFFFNNFLKRNGDCGYILPHTSGACLYLQYAP